MSESSNSSGYIIAPTGGDYISETAFIALTWVLFGLCLVAFLVRVYIRYACFRRLLFEDYLTLLALILHSVEAILIQLYAQYMYTVEDVERGDISVITPDFYSNSKKAFVALGASVNITIVGVLMIKVNFLLFFRRLTTNTGRLITIGWWAVLLFTVAGAIAQIAMQQFGCFFGSIGYIFSTNCTNPAALQRIFFNAIFSAVVDAVADFLIIAFPIAILWGSRIGIRQKLILTFVFSLVFLTIAITVVRGSVFHEEYAGNGRIQSGTFTWFWFYCEFSVAFLIACIVSFRTLFVQRNNKNSARIQEQQRREAAYQSAIRRGWRYKVRYFHDSVLDTCKTLEGWSGSDEETLRMHGLPFVPSGLMTVDFNDDSNWSRAATRDGTAAAKVSANRSGSVDSDIPLKGSGASGVYGVGR